MYLYDQLNLFNYSHDIDVDSVSKCEASNQQEFQIVSPPMPCGVAWLINVLLELGVKTTHHGKEYHNNHWTTDDGVNCKITPKAKDHLLWHLPVLSKQDYFEFVVKEFVPGIKKLGIQPLDAWYTLYGECSQILTAGVTENPIIVSEILSSDGWQTLEQKLLDYVENLERKVVTASAGFQL